MKKRKVRSENRKKRKRVRSFTKKEKKRISVHKNCIFLTFYSFYILFLFLSFVSYEMEQFPTVFLHKLSSNFVLWIPSSFILIPSNLSYEQREGKMDWK